jgi:hypothetical protein
VVKKPLCLQMSKPEKQPLPFTVDRRPHSQFYSIHFGRPSWLCNLELFEFLKGVCDLI